MPEIALLTSDALVVASALKDALFPSWGIYLNGAPVIQPASLISQVVTQAIAPVQNVAALFGADVPNLIPVTASTARFEFKQDWNVADYPVENGGFQSYDKVQLPFDVRVSLACGGSVTQRQTFLNTIQAMVNSLQLFDVVTPERTFTSCNANHWDWTRTASNGVTLLVVHVWFVEIRVKASSSFQNTQQPGNAGPQALGNVQATPAPDGVSKLYNASGGAS